jgi:hypothetical protein
MAQGTMIPFTGAALPYREKFYSKAWTPGTGAQDVSPPGNAIKSYGFARTIRLYTTTTTAGTGGSVNPSDSPWNLYSQISVTQPNGEEMYGGPTFTGYHAYLAAKHDAWKLNNDPATWPSYQAAATTFTLDLPIPFEINPEYGLGALPNQDFSAPWKIQVTGNLATGTNGIWSTTAPTTIPALNLDYFIDAWTVPAAQNPLNGAPQATQPVYLGTLSKWTLQSYTIPASTQFEVPFSRRGNAYRQLVFIARGANSYRVAATNFPNPISLRWDGTVIRSNDNPVLWVDDDFQIRGGSAALTTPTPDTGIMNLSMAAIAGSDLQGPAASLGEESFWGTVQSSTITLSGTWGASITLLEQVTNDVQLVDLTGNPYQFNAGTYLQAPAQVSARP